jgi:HEAT repeat protein
VSLLDTKRRLAALAAADSDEEIAAAAQALADTPGRRARQGLERLLASHERPEVRAKAAWALGFHAQGPQAAGSLLRTLADRDEDADVRAHAAEALGHLADRLGEREPDVLGALLHGLRDPSPEVRFWSAFALGNLGDEAAIPALELLAARDEESVPGWWSIRKEANDSIKQILLATRNRARPDGVDKV